MDCNVFEKSNMKYSKKQTKNKMGNCYFAPTQMPITTTMLTPTHHMNQGWYGNTSSNCRPFVRQHLIPFIQYLPSSICYFVYR